MAQISIITPSIRPKGLEIVWKALRRQTFQDFEWLIGSTFMPKHGKWVKDNFEGGKWTLNRIYNKLIKEAQGEIIVSWQDFTYAKPDTLEKLAFHLKENIIVGGVGDKYTGDDFMVKIWKDPRKTQKYGTYYETTFDNIEWNLCGLRKEAIYDVGGFDEGADFEYLGMDGYGVNERLNELGYKFYLDQTMESRSLTHGRIPDWEKLNGIHGKYTERRDKLRAKGKWVKMPYLRTSNKSK